MVDPTDKLDGSLPELDQDNLINQIDELENLLSQKKAAAQAQQPVLPRLNVGTDGIPVLVEAVTEEDMVTHAQPANNDLKNDDAKNNDQFINEIIDKIDKEITEDLDELILMLKDSIIDEVKTRLLQELKTNKDNSNENK
jgi:predicted component of type VI protein secretion system